MKKLMLSVLCLMFVLSVAVALVGCKGGHTHSFTVQKTEQAYIASAATCTQVARYYYSCSCGERCSDTFTYGSALGHEFGDWMVITPATAENEGLQRRTCSRCSEKEEQTIAKITHVHSYANAVIAPTCMERGYTLYSCACGDTYKDDYTNALNHSFADYVSDNNATCGQAGTKTAKCGRCGEADTIADVGSKKAHSFDGQEAIKEYLKSAATCTAPAKYYYSCSGCGEKGTETFAYGNALGHDLVEHEAKEATCTEKGWDAYETCTRCDYTTYVEIHALGHIADEWEVIQEPTCVEYGEEVSKCTRCGEVLEEEIPALGHDFVDGVCTRCGKTDLIPTEGLKYTLNSDKASYSCTGIGTATAKDIVIAKEYNDLPVTAIGDYAFYYCSGLTSITIQDSVTSIGESAFRGCSGLTGITIPDSVTSIAGGAFYCCSGLTGITIPDSVTSIAGGAFYCCSGLTSVTIPDSVTSIGYGAFSCCSGLESIVVEAGNAEYHSVNNCLIETASKTLILGCKNSIIPSDGSVTSIGEGAFYECSRLTSVTIGNSVTSIGDYAFSHCSELTGINIGNGVTSIGYQAFYDCSRLTSVTIGNSVTSIGEGAFAYCSGLTNIIIGNSVTSIGYEAFEACRGLTSITIPDSVTSIGDYAFASCSGLKTVYYKGTKTEKVNISIASDGNDDLTSATWYYYSETEPALNAAGTGYDDNYWYYDAAGEPVIWEKQ